MIELGLTRAHQLLARTPFPWRAVHVAGTNGKGSVCAYISAMLDCYNSSTLPSRTGHRPLRYGRFTSPHLIDRWDCISIDGKTVEESFFASIEDSLHTRNVAQNIKASEFEILTATAFEIFTQAKVDIGIVEVGMGGRLDSTNIIGQLSDHDDVSPHGLTKEIFRPAPLVTAITSIGLDHQAFLGNTVVEIAREKAGILKTGVPAVVAAQAIDVVEAVKSQALRVGSGPVFLVTSETTAADVWATTGKRLFDQLAGLGVERRLQDPIQRRWPNGAVAVQAVWQSLHSMGRLADVPDGDLISLLLDMTAVPDNMLWPGRLQTLDLSKLTGFVQSTVLDGAHNTQSAEVLEAFVRERYPSQAAHWLLAASAGKDINEILGCLLRPGDAVSAVEFGPVDGMPWVKPMRSEDILDKTTQLHGIGTADAHGTDVLGAILEASRLARDHHRVLVIAGSLYLVGDVLRLLKRGRRISPL